MKFYVTATIISSFILLSFLSEHYTRETEATETTKRIAIESKAAVEITINEAHWRAEIAKVQAEASVNTATENARGTIEAAKIQAQNQIDLMNGMKAGNPNVEQKPRWAPNLGL